MPQDPALEAEPPIALFAEIESMLAKILPADFIVPSVGTPDGSFVIGLATERMKRMFSLFEQLEAKSELGASELCRRAVHVALSYEVGKHFNHFGALFGINRDWQVFSDKPLAKPSPP